MVCDEVQWNERQMTTIEPVQASESALSSLAPSAIYIYEEEARPPQHEASQPRRLSTGPPQLSAAILVLIADRIFYRWGSRVGSHARQIQREAEREFGKEIMARPSNTCQQNTPYLIPGRGGEDWSQ
jgi:hypothetical protein